MPSEETTPEKIRIKYRKSEDYRIVHGSGVYGGLTPEGSIKFDIYTEYQPPPDEEIKTVGEDGKLTPLEETNEKSITIERERQVGVIISVNQAKSIINWLRDKVETIENQ